jgi:hypothetical protein
MLGGILTKLIAYIRRQKQQLLLAVKNSAEQLDEMRSRRSCL